MDNVLEGPSVTSSGRVKKKRKKKITVKERVGGIGARDGLDGPKSRTAAAPKAAGSNRTR